MTYDQFLRQRLFEPLGMTDTGFNVPDKDAGRVAMIYRHTTNGLEKGGAITLGTRAYFSGAGGLNATA